MQKDKQAHTQPSLCLGFPDKKQHVNEGNKK